MDERQRRELHEALLQADAFEELPGKSADRRRRLRGIRTSSLAGRARVPLSIPHPRGRGERHAQRGGSTYLLPERHDAAQSDPE
jgi:hypothetical protein